MAEVKFISDGTKPVAEVYTVTKPQYAYLTNGNPIPINEMFTYKNPTDSIYILDSNPLGYNESPFYVRKYLIPDYKFQGKNLGGFTYGTGSIANTNKYKFTPGIIIPNRWSSQNAPISFGFKNELPNLVFTNEGKYPTSNSGFVITKTSTGFRTTGGKSYETKSSDYLLLGIRQPATLSNGNTGYWGDNLDTNFAWDTITGSGYSISAGISNPEGQSRSSLIWKPSDITYKWYKLPMSSMPNNIEIQDTSFVTSLITGSTKSDLTQSSLSLPSPWSSVQKPSFVKTINTNFSSNFDFDQRIDILQWWNEGWAGIKLNLKFGWNFNYEYIRDEIEGSTGRWSASEGGGGGFIGYGYGIDVYLGLYYKFTRGIINVGSIFRSPYNGTKAESTPDDGFDVTIQGGAWQGPLYTGVRTNMAVKILTGSSSSNPTLSKDVLKKTPSEGIRTPAVTLILVKH